MHAPRAAVRATLDRGRDGLRAARAQPRGSPDPARCGIRLAATLAVGVTTFIAPADTDSVAGRAAPRRRRRARACDHDAAANVSPSSRPRNGSEPPTGEIDLAARKRRGAQQLLSASTGDLPRHRRRTVSGSVRRASPRWPRSLRQPPRRRRTSGRPCARGRRMSDSRFSAKTSTRADRSECARLGAVRVARLGRRPIASVRRHRRPRSAEPLRRTKKTRREPLEEPSCASASTVADGAAGLSPRWPRSLRLNLRVCGETIPAPLRLARRSGPRLPQSAGKSGARAGSAARRRRPAPRRPRSAPVSGSPSSSAAKPSPKTGTSSENGATVPAE